MKFFRKLYKEFYGKYGENFFVKDCKELWKIKEKESLLRKVYRILEKDTFVEFMMHLKFIFFSKSIFDYINLTCQDIRELWLLLNFLVKKKVIKLKGDKVKVKKELLKFFVKEKSEREIERILRETVGKLDKEKPLANLFRAEFKWKYDYDQLPISTSSAIFIISRILHWLPFYDNFLFIGDDDFLSILLKLVDKKIRVKVVDIDKELLLILEKTAEEFGLEIETERVDIRKDALKENFIGFFTNPPYTEAGIRSFVNFGVKSLSKDGGLAFLTFSYEPSNRQIFLQKFFASKNLILLEMHPGVITYPFYELDEYKKVKERLRKLTKTKIRKVLSANFYSFTYIPWKVKRIVKKKSIYCYI